jgi:hypothetical protein
MVKELKEISQVEKNHYATFKIGGAAYLAYEMLKNEHWPSDSKVYEILVEELKKLSCIKNQEMLTLFCDLLDHNELILVNYSKVKNNGKKEDRVVYDDGGFHYYTPDNRKHYVQPGSSTTHAVSCIKRFIGNKSFEFVQDTQMTIYPRKYEGIEVIMFEYTLKVADSSMNYQFFLGCNFLPKN